MINNNESSENNFTEEWTRWEPSVEGLRGCYYIGDVYDGSFFKTTLTSADTRQMVEVRFRYPIMATRHINESLCFNIYDELRKKYGSDFLDNWAFFKIKNSDFLNRLYTYSSGLSEIYKLQHFVILGQDCILDIAASEEPEFRVIPSSELIESFKSTVKMKANGIINRRNYSKDGQPVYEVFEGASSTKHRGVR